jgi:beta-galactosidase
MKTWEDISDQVVFPKGVRHGTALEVNEKIINALK